MSDNKQDILISIVVPVYNVEEYLNDCVKSLVNQTYKNIEIILVDDGSTDNSGKLCDKWEKKDSRIKAFHKLNGGLSDARNYGTQRISGEYTMYVDSDDCVNCNIIEVLLSSLIETNAQVAICDFVHVFNNSEAEYTFSNSNSMFTAEQAVCEMWYQSSFLPSATGKLYNTDIIKEVPFRKGILFEDIDMMHKVLFKCDRVVYNKSKLYAYQHRDGSITTNRFTQRDCEILNICNRINAFAEDKSDNLKAAAKSYGVVGALRVYLNAPREDEFKETIDTCKKIIKDDGKEVMRDGNARKKTRVALMMYFYMKPLMFLLYKKVNRWK